MSDKSKSLAQRIEDESNRLLMAIADNDMSPLPEIYRNLRDLIFTAAYLQNDWSTEHDERIRLEARLSAARAQAQALKDMADEYYELWQALKEA